MDRPIIHGDVLKSKELLTYWFVMYTVYSEGETKYVCFRNGERRTFRRDELEAIT